MDWLLTIFSNLNSLGASPCFFSRDSLFPYAKVKDRIVFIAEKIQSELPDSKIIGIITGDDIDTYCTVLSCLYLGKTYVPINRKNPVLRNLQIIKEAGIELVFCSDSKMHDELSAQGVNTISINTPVFLKEVQKTDQLLNMPVIQEDEIAYVLFTSGSTGLPKGVPITYRSMGSFIMKVVNDPLFNYSKEDRFLQMFELSFDPSVFSIMAPLYFGASCYIVPDSGMIFHHVFNMLEDHSITVALLTPSVINFLRPYFKEINIPSLRYSMFCGEALHTSVSKEWQECAPNASLHNWYGPTEATVICLQYYLEPNQIGGINDIVPIGKPLPNITAILLNEHNVPIHENNIEGELCLEGDQVINNYWNNPEANRSSFISIEHKKYYRTGDLCLRDSNANFLYVGRKDFQAKINGYRLELTEIEHYARSHESINQSVVIKKNDQELVMFIETNGNEYDEDSFIASLRSVMPWYMIPGKVIRVDQMPYNQNMKIDRKQLADLIK